MNKPERVLAAAARSRLDEYLDAVERALADTGMSRAERRAVCDEIDAQACEMVHARAEGEPTAQDMKAVLAELDDPEAYRDTAGPSGQASGPAKATDDEPKIHRLAIWAFAIPFIEFFLMFTPLHPHGETPMYITWAVVSFLCIALGTMAIHDIRRRPDRYRGVGLAVFGMLAIPMMVFCVFGYLLAEGGLVAELIFGPPFAKQCRIEERQQWEECLRWNKEHGGGTPAPPSPELLAPGPPEKLIATEKWLLKHQDSLEPVVGAVLVVALLGFAALIFLVVYRCCRPKRAGPAKRLLSGSPEPQSH